MTPRRVIVHPEYERDDYPALLVDTRWRETEHPGFIDGRKVRVEEALVIRLDPDPDHAYQYDWVPLGRVEDAEDDIREDEPWRVDPDTGEPEPPRRIRFVPPRHL